MHPTALATVLLLVATAQLPGTGVATDIFEQNLLSFDDGDGDASGSGDSGSGSGSGGDSGDDDAVEELLFGDDDSSSSSDRNAGADNDVSNAVGLTAVPTSLPFVTPKPTRATPPPPPPSPLTASPPPAPSPPAIPAGVSSRLGGDVVELSRDDEDGSGLLENDDSSHGGYAFDDINEDDSDGPFVYTVYLSSDADGRVCTLKPSHIITASGGATAPFTDRRLCKAACNMDASCAGIYIDYLLYVPDTCRQRDIQERHFRRLPCKMHALAPPAPYSHAFGTTKERRN